MKFYGYVLLGAIVFMSIIGNVGKAQIEKRIEASQQAQEAEIEAENTTHTGEGDAIDEVDGETTSGSKSDVDNADSDSKNDKKSVDTLSARLRSLYYN